MGGKPKVGTCRKCGQERRIKGRGCCSGCYKAELAAEKAGTAGRVESLERRIDFGLAPFLLEEIQRRADAEYRDIGRQVLWELSKMIGPRAEG